jgi:hypothetical protein
MKFAKILLLLTLTFFQINIFSQVIGGTNKKLAKLYNSGKYEICFFKADDMCNDETLNRDAEPFLYAAMCMVKLYQSEDPDIAVDYQDGMKQAVKYAQKFAKKDREGDLYNKNIEFIQLLKEDLKKEIKEQFEKTAYSKVVTAAKNYDKLNREEDFVLLYYIGICEVLSNNVGQGERDMADAKDKLKEPIIKNEVKIDPIAKGFIVDGFLKYTEMLVQAKKQSVAKDAITLANKLFPNDGYITVQFNLINTTTGTTGTTKKK